MCSETSPRISFSNDLIQQQHEEEDEEDSLIQNDLRRDRNLLDSNSDFEFTVCSSASDRQSSSADELFSDGMILPSVHLPQAPLNRNVSLPPLPFDYASSVAEDRILNAELEEKRSIWGFKRSSSLNCDLKKSLICSLPLLSRSNSTGSAPKQRSAAACRDLNKQKQQPGKKVGGSNSSGNYVYSIPQKPPLKKFNGGKVMSPVLNVPPPYIGKGAASLFGLGSFLRNGKDKSRR